ncbi:MAG TPA: bifunctional (p)ppGpp synthetase/guanosine-3',5'-bis(diphosphate) 3'-pyrophosphohydrolase, partial [Gammaproteobacteria bacterium]|nr:bifunctional (p)ppGpp synthetase/guanosine-3',5'-bis(diphosphate) 3'-pyrophosphohydrolase [Gammaproteobacteria bacterium]
TQGVMHLDHTQNKHAIRQKNISISADSSDNLRRMLLAVIEDIRVVIIKLAERIAALRSCTDVENEACKNIALEAQEIYSPLANRLGIGQIKWEIEDLAFRILEPLAYKQIAKALDEKRLDREEYILKIIDQVTQALNREGIQAHVKGRVKHIYSIWRKMQRKNLDFNEIYDVRAIRIVVPKIQDCYAALGVVHSLWQHIHKEFDDYIATPKENGYRSLHTAVIGPFGKTLEIQIRTGEMHQEAELGVAAHWVYKEEKKQDARYQSKLSAIRQLLEESAEFSDQKEYQSLVHSELQEDRVYVFSPMGDVLDLPRGSTPIDFAFEIHTQLGYRCRGAKVNGVMVPLTHQLKSGDQVEILSAKREGPSRDWLNTNLGFLKSTKALAKVHAWFKKQKRDENIEQGREILEREMRRLDLEKSNLQKVAVKLNFKAVEDLFAAIGSGDTKLGHVLNTFQTPEPIKQEIPVSRISRIKDANVKIQGIGNLMSSFAKCCKPVPGDRIVGYLTVGRGVSIHRQDCLNVLEVYPDQRVIQVEWMGISQSVFPVDIEIHALDRHDLLRDITSIISHEKINVTGISSKTHPNEEAVKIIVNIQVQNLELLARILNKILQLPNIIEAKRVTLESKK